MKPKKKRVFLKLIALTTVVCFLSILSFFVVFYKTTKDSDLDFAKLENTTNANSTIIYDTNGNEMDANLIFNGNCNVKIDDIPNHVKNAFICTEDKRFYSHNGIDYKRIVGAIVNNIKTGSFSQGASTISQQLIKNTHLTREKTFERKLKEIKLAYLLEQKYSKDQILEMYLNNIYFGNGCYGIEKASNYYFEKSAKDLSVGEAALLVATINAPSIYDPIKKQNNVEKRKKLVLKNMLNQGFLTDIEFEKSAKNKENVLKNNKFKSNLHYKSILNEVAKKLKISESKVKNMNLIIETYIDNNLQSIVDNVVKSVSVSKDLLAPKNAKFGVLVLDNDNCGVVAISGSNGVDLLNEKRQPGSTIKPIMVYAPAFENKLIYPESIISDEEININGYSPSNANKKFSGNVSVRESVEKSLNIPAVKVLSKVGVNNAKNFSRKLGLTFSEKDNNLALALGGMTDGLSVKQIADAYSAFANKGKFKPSSLIKRILDKSGNVLYEDLSIKKEVFNQSTADIITDLLKGVARQGTARRLNSFDFDIASKTGTVGVVGSSQNTDAYNVSYTTKHTVVSWVGSFDNNYLPANVNGSTYPTIMTKNVLEEMYVYNKPKKFEMSKDLVYRYIDLESLKLGKVEIADDEINTKNKRLALFDGDNLPAISQRFALAPPVLEVSMEENEKPTLVFDANKRQEYILLRKDLNSGKIQKIKGFKNKEKTQKYTDNSANSGVVYEYILKTKKINEDEVCFSNSIKLMSF